LDPDLLLAAWVHEEMPPELVPEIASNALEKGCDSPTLRRLAGETAPLTRHDLEPLVRRTFAELGFTLPDAAAATAFLVNHWARLIVERKVEPYLGAKRIWQFSNEWWGKPEWQRLSIFVGLASEWEDYPPGRDGFKKAILQEAERLLAEGGIEPPIPDHST
jgi:hypothetical protein